MKLYAFGWIPVTVNYVDEMSDGFGGMAHLTYIDILKKYENDVGLHEHELEHIEQAYSLLIVGYWFLYRSFDSFARWSEVKAYRRQIAYYKAHGQFTGIEWAVTLLSQKYSFTLSPDEARKLLLE